MRQFRYLNHILIWNIFFGVVIIPTAGKLVDISGILLSVTIFYFPFIYIFSDIMTEVYGYAVARRMLWYTIGAQVFATLLFQFAVYYPPSATMTNNQSFADVLSSAPRFVLFGTMALFIGDIVNNYVLAKMKVWTKGKYIVAMPFTLRISKWLKKVENVDFYDYKTDFNPLKL